MQRILFSFEKLDPVRYLSHLDLMRAFERAIRRAGLPIALSEGFNPRPKLVFASALALGATSEAEQATVELTEPLTPEELIERLNDQLPKGLRLLNAREIPPVGKTPLGALNRAEYRLLCAVEEPNIQFEHLNRAIERFLACEQYEIVRESPKGRRRINIRAKVLSIEPVSIQENEIVIMLQVRIGGEGSTKPSEVVTALKQDLPGLRLVQMHRTRLLASDKTDGQEIDNIG